MDNRYARLSPSLVSESDTYFFTVNLLKRRDNDLLNRHIDKLRLVVKEVRARHPLSWSMDGWCCPCLKCVYPADWAGGQESVLEYDGCHPAQCPLVIAPY